MLYLLLCLSALLIFIGAALVVSSSIDRLIFLQDLRMKMTQASSVSLAESALNKSDGFDLGAQNEKPDLIAQSFCFMQRKLIELADKPERCLNLALIFAAVEICLIGLLAGHFFLAIALAVLAFVLLLFIPSHLKRLEEQERLERAIAELPKLIDIVALGMSAGISFDSALALYCERSKTSFAADIYDELQSWSLGLNSREQSFERLCALYPFEGLRCFCNTILESLRFGSPLSAVLEEQSEKMRRDHQAFIQEKIEKAPVKMLLPIGVLILPAMLLTIVGPLMASALLVTR